MGERTPNSTLELKVGSLTFTLLLLNFSKANTSSLPFSQQWLKMCTKLRFFPVTLFGFCPCTHPHTSPRFLHLGDPLPATLLLTTLFGGWGRWLHTGYSYMWKKNVFRLVLKLPFLFCSKLWWIHYLHFSCADGPSRYLFINSIDSVILIFGSIIFHVCQEHSDFCFFNIYWDIDIEWMLYKIFRW